MSKGGEKMARRHLSNIMRDYTHSLKIIPQLHGDFTPDDERAELSPLGQIDTLYQFDVSHIRLQRLINIWKSSRLLVCAADGQEFRVNPADIFMPMSVVFMPKIVYSKDRQFGKIHLVTQLPTKELPAKTRITVPIVDPANFSIVVSTGIFNYRLAYNWENRLCVY